MYYNCSERQTRSGSSTRQPSWSSHIQNNREHPIAQPRLQGRPVSGAGRPDHFRATGTHRGTRTGPHSPRKRRHSLGRRHNQPGGYDPSLPKPYQQPIAGVTELRPGPLDQGAASEARPGQDLGRSDRSPQVPSVLH
jgi:hypothetical protein